MFLLSCGRSSLVNDTPNLEMNTDTSSGSYETFFTKHASTDMQGNMSFAWLQAKREENIRKRSSLSVIQSEMQAPVCFRQHPNTQVQSKWMTLNADEVLIPEMYVGVYHFFCNPEQWSPVFAAPGEFTIKIIDTRFENMGAIFTLAIVCSCIKSLSEDGRSRKVSKKCAFVKYVMRSEKQMVSFVRAMSLRYIGHRFAARWPHRSAWSSGFPGSKSALEYSKAVQMLLCELLSTTEVGFNSLVVLKDPLIEDLCVRQFLDLMSGFGDPSLISTSSCDARIESKQQRPLLPALWTDESSTTETIGHIKMQDLFLSPRQKKDQKLAEYGVPKKSASAYMIRNYPTLSTVSGATTARQHKCNHCIHFICPDHWPRDRHSEDSFTVEITSVCVTSNVAYYCISVLSYLHGRLYQTIVKRRYSEFIKLTALMDTKLKALHLFEKLPLRSIFRTLQASFLEERANLLQEFLERMLQMNFSVILGQKVPIAADPHIRQFLNLPAVSWNLVPQSLTTTLQHDRMTWKQNTFSLPRQRAEDNSSCEIYSPRHGNLTSPLSSSDFEESHYCSIGRRSNASR